MSVNQQRLLKKYSSLITGIFVFVIYMFTIAPSVIQIDSGELAAVQSTLGIAHPTGYPLFTILGFLWLKVPFPATQIFKANLLASIWCALGIVLFTKSVQILLSNLIFPLHINKKLKHAKILKPQSSNEEIEIILPSVLAGILLGFSKTFWQQSTSVEVYSLQIFLFCLIILTTLKAYYKPEDKITNWVWVGISLALGFGNHMTTLLLLPFVAILFFKKEKFNSRSVAKIVVTFFIAFPILILLYLYLPWRGSSNPQLNWGNPINFENFWCHFTGRQYQVWLFSSTEAAKKQLLYFIKNLPVEFIYIGLLVILIGFYQTFKKSKLFFVVLIISFLFGMLYSINYDIVDIDSYFLSAYIMLGIISAFGFQKFFIWLHREISDIQIVRIFAVTFIALPIALNFHYADQSKQYAFEDYSRAILSSVEKDAVIFSYQWDYFISPSYYFQFVENFRKDVTVIDKELLRRSWYFNQIKRNHPEVVTNLGNEINDFLTALKPFERGENFNPDLLEKNYRTIMTKLISENIDKRSYYIGLELFQNEMQRGEFSLPDGYQIVPQLFLFKVVKGSDYVPLPDPNFTIRFPENRNKYVDFIENAVASMLTYRATYELQFNKPERAKIYVEKIRRDFPNYQIPYDILSRVN